MPPARQEGCFAWPPMPMSRLFRRLLKVVAVSAGLAAAGLSVLLVWLWVERRTDVTLPAPSGPFAVGREIVDWADDASTDAQAPVPGTRRELVVWIWYPAAPSTSTVDDYLPAPLRAAAAGANRPPLIVRALTRDPSRVHGHSLRA